MAPSTDSSSKHSSKRHSLNSIESSVTRLLVSTKHLLESLTQWARQEVDDKFVSDAYVKLGNDFRAASRAFTHAGIDISDIGDVPQALRIILEAALSEAPSQDNLDRFLPNIRNIIVTLLQNLKAKQGKARTLSSEKSNDSSNHEKIFVNKQRQKLPEKSHQGNHSDDSNDHHRSQNPFQTPSHSNPTDKPSHENQSLINETADKNENGDAYEAHQAASRHRSPSYNQKPDSSTSLFQGQEANHSVSDRNLSPDYTKSSNKSEPLHDREVSRDTLSEQGALLQLQNENVLQRRASKRFSAYQYAKLANINPSNSLPNVTSPDSKRSPLTQTAREAFKERSPRRSFQESTNDKEDTYVFLKINNQTKKASLKAPVSFASLRLLFVEKFAYSPGSSDFPSIYIVDPKTGVYYELEDQYLSDVKDGTLLCLNEINPSDSNDLNGRNKTILSEDEKKQEDNSSWTELHNVVTSLKEKFESLDVSISTAVKEALKEIEFPAVSEQYPTPVSADIDKVKSTPMSELGSEMAQASSESLSKEAIKEINFLENDMKVIRQLQKSNKSSVETFINDINAKVGQLQSTGVDASKSSNRAYMEKCHSKLSDESDSLLTKVDDLQDLMEALRKDVAQRGVRVSDQQLKLTMREITEAHDTLKQMSSYIDNEKGVWKKIWEAELDKVCEEQQFFNLQDDLTKDLEEDISKIRETFDLIQQCSQEQSKQSNHRRNKVVANLYIPEPGENLNNIKDAVLNEVISLRPDHQSRVDAIQRAERLREKERELMGLTKFQEELGNFVDDSKLKKSGGIEELERQRQLKDSENLKSSLGGI